MMCMIVEKGREAFQLRSNFVLTSVLLITVMMVMYSVHIILSTIGIMRKIYSSLHQYLFQVSSTDKKVSFSFHDYSFEILSH